MAPAKTFMVKNTVPHGRRIADLLMASVALIFFLPVLVLLVAAMKLRASRVTERKEQIGLGGRTFSRWCWAVNGNRYDRFTIGMLRELRFAPALLNVIAGDMAIVGPTPRSQRQIKALAYLAPDYHRLLSVKPGIISPASATEGLSTAGQLQRELDYVSRWSLTNDLRIICGRVTSGSHEEGSFGLE